jgi:hypothetical protein
MIGERTPTPVLGDVAEQPVLDFVPLRRPVGGDEQLAGVGIRLLPHVAPPAGDHRDVDASLQHMHGC